MRVVASLLAVEIHSGVARIIWRWCWLILALKTLVAGPSFDERAIHTEVLVGKQVGHARLVQHQLEELLCDIALQEPVPILGEDCRHPHCFVHIEAHEPAKKQVVLQLLHQHPFTANRI